MPAPPDGLTVIVTARSERRDLAIGTADCRSFELNPFAVEESEEFVRARRPHATTEQAHVVHRRADGNPRVMANLIEPGRDLVAETQTETRIAVDTLIEERIDASVKLANSKGAERSSLDTFLCALSVLPPPVPIVEMAIAFGIPSAEVESLTSDLSPLLERTRHGIIFRDEPTETLVQRKYGSQLSLLDDVVGRLTAAQSTSSYAGPAPFQVCSSQ